MEVITKRITTKEVTEYVVKCERCGKEYKISFWEGLKDYNYCKTCWEICFSKWYEENDDNTQEKN